MISERERERERERETDRQTDRQTDRWLITYDLGKENFEKAYLRQVVKGN